MRALLSLAIAVATTGAVSTAALAAPGVVVPIDQSVRLNVGGSAYSVLVGNPGIADVAVVDSHTLFVSGRAYGTTDVTVLDRDGGTLFQAEVVVAAPEAGRVSIYRGAARTDMACAPGCQVAGQGGGGGGGGAKPTLSGAISTVTGTP